MNELYRSVRESCLTTLTCNQCVMLTAALKIG
jgi:hypothetical protein